MAHETLGTWMGSCPHSVCVFCVLGARPREVCEAESLVPGVSQTLGLEVRLVESEAHAIWQRGGLL